MAEKLTAFCNKCGWVGKVEPGFHLIPHDGCNYSACYSPTEINLHALMEAAKPIMEIIDHPTVNEHYLDDDVIEIDVWRLRALRSALSKINGGGNG